MDADQVKQGIEVEYEHKPTFRWLRDYILKNGTFPPIEAFAQNISKDHLKEIPDYYTRLAKMEAEAKGGK